MTHNQFKPETTALVLIDYQVGTLQLIKTLSSDQSLRNAVMLAKAAKALGMPVVLTTTNTIIAELVQDWSTPEGMELVKLLVATAPMMQPVE
jgi:nicotinamidase-related amidase